MEAREMKILTAPSHVSSLPNSLPLCSTPPPSSQLIINKQPCSHEFSLDHSNTSAAFFNRFLSPLQIFSPNTTSSLSGDSALIDGNKEQPANIIDERRIRRMASNRESARRSRMRKKRQIEELQSQVDQLLTMNHQLSEKVIRLLESNHQVMQENGQLKEKVSSLQLVLSDILTPLRSNVEQEMSRGVNHIRGVEASNQSAIMDLVSRKGA
ncbi:basic leucine zipper 43-like [Carica papaya]|uniref:basic leucine zipper 43-like n=1 Tax=Carica papaya TaxID=3649 RepID=UPI000B8C79BB|nr:basic leucine zipper 43-like [Carica papaya]